MSQTRVPPNRLVVEAKYFLRIETSEDNLKDLKATFADLMANEGYISKNQANSIFPEVIDSYRAINFELDFNKKPASFSAKLKRALRIMSKQKLEKKRYFDRFRELRGDIPFNMEIRFNTVVEEKREGYEVEVQSIPVALQKRKQGLIKGISEDKIEDILNTNKQFISRVMSKLEGETLLEPQSPAEITKNSLSSKKRAMFEKMDYGNKIITHIDEGDACFREDLLHSALNSYVHSIEWTIICYLHNEENINIIEEEKDGDPYYFHELVSKLEENASLSQKTSRKLKNMNSAERRWISHHKTGNILESEVLNVKERFEILVNELF